MIANRYSACREVASQGPSLVFLLAKIYVCVAYYMWPEGCDRAHSAFSYHAGLGRMPPADALTDVLVATEGTQPL